MQSCTLCRSFNAATSFADGSTQENMPGAVKKGSYSHPKEQLNAPGLLGGSGGSGTGKHKSNTPGHAKK